MEAQLQAYVSAPTYLFELKVVSHTTGLVELLCALTEFILQLCNIHFIVLIRGEGRFLRFLGLRFSIIGFGGHFSMFLWEFIHNESNIMVNHLI